MHCLGGNGRWTTLRVPYRTESGEWFNDEAAHAYESNGMGGDNSIVDLSG